MQWCTLSPCRARPPAVVDQRHRSISEATAARPEGISPFHRAAAHPNPWVSPCCFARRSSIVREELGLLPSSSGVSRRARTFGARDDGRLPTCGFRSATVVRGSTSRSRTAPKSVSVAGSATTACEGDVVDASGVRARRAAPIGRFKPIQDARNLGNSGWCSQLPESQPRPARHGHTRPAGRAHARQQQPGDPSAAARARHRPGRALPLGCGLLIGAPQTRTIDRG